MVWKRGHPEDCGCVTQVQVLEGGVTLETGCVSPDAWYGKWGHSGDCGGVTPHTGTGGWGYPAGGRVNPGTGSGMGVRLDCGRVTPGVWSERGHHPGNQRHVTSGSGSWRGVTQETVNM